MKVKNMEEAIALANDSDLGLTASVWSKDHAKAEKIAEQIQSGVVTINDHLMSHGMAETPWGGFKNSGIGRTHGSLGFDEMTQPQLLVNDILPLVKKNMWWHPYSKRIYDGLRGAINILYGKGLKDRVAGIVPLLKIVPRYFTKS
jgi:succinate-semialdehyde dehydrogenase/glutarate-semialdehyde dehydrogenase